MYTEKIHNIARGVCVSNGRILLAWHKRNEYYFLPGGHIELGEAATATLVRECMEEFGQEVVCGNFQLLFEHIWQNGNVIQHELTSVFNMTCDPEADLVSRVPHLEFRWVTVSNFTTVRFLPAELQRILMGLPHGISASPFVSTIH